MESKILYIYTIYFQGNERVVVVNSENNGIVIPVPLIYKTQEDAQNPEVLKAVQKICDENNTVIELSQYTLNTVLKVYHGNNVTTH